MEQYLNAVISQLRNHGFLRLRRDLETESISLVMAAQNPSFEISVGPVTMRGEAFFVFSRFANVNVGELRSYADTCLQWARSQSQSKRIGDAFFNARVPTQYCFAVIVADCIEASSIEAICQDNPFDRQVDLLWYLIPVVYALREKRAYFYEKPANFFDYFKGEIIWQKFREIIRDVLEPQWESQSSKENTPVSNTEQKLDRKGRDIEYHFYGSVGQVVTGDMNVSGDNIGMAGDRTEQAGLNNVTAGGDNVTNNKTFRTERSPSSQKMSGSPSDLKQQVRQRQIEALKQEIQAVSSQWEATISDEQRLRLQRRLDRKLQELEELERD